MASDLQKRLDAIHNKKIMDFKEKAPKFKDNLKETSVYKDQLDNQDNGYASSEAGSLEFMNQESEVFENLIMAEDRPLSYDDIVNSVYKDMNLLEDANDNNSNYFTGSEYMDDSVKGNLAFDFGLKSPEVSTDDIKNAHMSDSNNPSALELGHYLGMIKDYSMIKASFKIMMENDIPPQDMFASKEGALEFGDKLNASIGRMSKYMSAEDGYNHIEFKDIDMNKIYNENEYTVDDTDQRLRIMDNELAKAIHRQRDNDKGFTPTKLKKEYHAKSNRFKKLRLEDSFTIDTFDKNDSISPMLHSLDQMKLAANIDSYHDRIVNNIGASFENSVNVDELMTIADTTNDYISIINKVDNALDVRNANKDLVSLKQLENYSETLATKPLNEYTKGFESGEYIPESERQLKWNKDANDTKYMIVKSENEKYNGLVVENDKTVDVMPIDKDGDTYVVNNLRSDQLEDQTKFSSMEQNAVPLVTTFPKEMVSQNPDVLNVATQSVIYNREYADTVIENNERNFVKEAVEKALNDKNNQLSNDSKTINKEMSPAD